MANIVCESGRKTLNRGKASRSKDISYKSSSFRKLRTSSLKMFTISIANLDQR